MGKERGVYMAVDLTEAVCDKKDDVVFRSSDRRKSFTADI